MCIGIESHANNFSSVNFCFSFVLISLAYITIPQNHGNSGMRMGLTPYLKNSIVIDSIRTLRKTKGVESPRI